MGINDDEQQPPPPFAPQYNQYNPSAPPAPLGLPVPLNNRGDVALTSFSYDGAQETSAKPAFPSPDIVPLPGPDNGGIEDVVKRTGDMEYPVKPDTAVDVSHETSDQYHHDDRSTPEHAHHIHIRGPSKLRMERIMVYLLMFAIYSGLGILCCYFNWLVGIKGKWGFSFLIALLVVPILFSIPLLPLFVMKRATRHIEVTMFLASWGMLYLVGISFPIAVTGGRTKVANELGTMKAPTTISANCWENNKPPISSEDWNKKVEFIAWGDSEWYVDEVRQRYASYKEEGITYTYCAAPIRLRATSQVRHNCTGFFASALCYEQQTASGPCSATAIAACVWNLRGNNVGYSRVLRPHAFYKSYGDSAEYKYSNKAVQAAWAAVGNLSGSYQVLPVQWMADMDPMFFMDKIGALEYSIWVQYIVYICVWIGTSFCGFLVTAIRRAKE